MTGLHGQPGGTRTPDIRLRRSVLYPVELRAGGGAWGGSKYGRGGGIRTHDHLVPNQVRYQAALRPDGVSVTYYLVCFVMDVDKMI